MAPQSTPGRRRERGDKYLPYNARPKDVGTATGLPMPSPQQLNSDGFEDPNEFFKSPNNSTVRDPAMESIVSALRRTPGGASVESLDGGSARKRKGRGRMSQLGGESDDEPGGGEDGGLMGDGDEAGFEDAQTTPGGFFRDSRHKSVPLPKRSTLPPASPSISTPYESLPSPSRRHTKGTRSILPPTPSTGKTSRFDNTQRDSPVIDEEGSLDMDLETEVDITPRTNRGRKSGMTDVSEIGVGRDGRSSLGRFAGRKSGLSRRGGGDDDDDDDEGLGRGNESADLAGFDASMGMDTVGDITLGGLEDDEVIDEDGVEDDQGGDGGGEEVQGEDDPDEGASMEAAAIAEENREESEEEDENGDETEPVERRKNAPPKVVKKPVVKRKPVTNTNGDRGPIPLVKKRTRLSRLAAEEEGDGYHGDFQMRRSNRRHMAPLDFWRNEKVEYVKGEIGPEPVQVVRIPKQEAGPLGAKKTGRGRGNYTRSRSKNSDDEGGGRGEEALEGEGVDDETEPLMQVLDYITGLEAMRRIACPRSRFDPVPVSGGQFKYQKMFGDEGYFATGIVVIPVGGEKPAKPSKDNCYMFHVIRGIVQVTLHATEFTMGPGSMFFIPRGNTYQIKNVSENDEAELVFSQARKIKEGEDDASAGKRMMAELEKKKAERNGRGESLGRLTEFGDGEEEEDEGSVKPDVKKRRKSRV